MIGNLQVVRIYTYSFIKKVKLNKSASYIVFFFDKLEKNYFVKEIKHVLRAFIAWWNLLREFNPWLRIGFSPICALLNFSVEGDFYDYFVIALGKEKRNLWVGGSGW